MPQPFLAYVIPISGGHPDNSLPGGGGVSVQPPIYHPGHPDHGRPVDPGYGRPGGGGRPNRPDQGLPGGRPGRPDNSLPGEPEWGVDLEHPDNSLPEGGEPVRPGTLPEPTPPPNLKDKIIAGLYVPDHGWTWKSYPMPDEGIDNTLPEGGSGNRPDNTLPPSAQPKSRR